MGWYLYTIVVQFRHNNNSWRVIFIPKGCDCNKIVYFTIEL